MTDLIISLHIPKTAGSTFKSILSKVYGSKYLEIHNTHTVEEVGEIFRLMRMDNYDCVHGHFPYGVHKYLPETVTYKYITFLRDPLERLISMWNFNTVSVDGTPQEKVRDINKFIEWTHQYPTATVDNGITRIIEGSKEVFFTDTTSTISQDDYEIAKENLKSFFFVGTSETFTKDLLELASKLHWGKIPEYVDIYRLPGRLTSKDLSNSNRRVFQKKLMFDFLLWNQIKDNKRK